MHGIVLKVLKSYVETRFGADTWPALLKEAGLGMKLYMPIQDYPDKDVVSLISAASKATGRTSAALLEDFGTFMMPELIKMYSFRIRPEWRTLDFLLHAEEHIHGTVRQKEAGSAPPVLKVEKSAPNQVQMTYSSERKLCAMAKGMAKGLAQHYKEDVVITEARCMLSGCPSCLISVKLLGTALKA